MQLSKNFVLISLFAFESGVWSLPLSGQNAKPSIPTAAAPSVATATHARAMPPKNNGAAVLATPVPQKPKATPPSRVTAKATSTPGSAPINKSTYPQKHTVAKDGSGRGARSKAIAHPNGKKDRVRSPTRRGPKKAVKHRSSRGRNHAPSGASDTSRLSSQGSKGGRTPKSKPRASRKKGSSNGSQNVQKNVAESPANQKVVSKPQASSRPSGPKPTAVTTSRNGGTSSPQRAPSVVKKNKPEASQAAAALQTPARDSAPAKATTTPAPPVTPSPPPASITGAERKQRLHDILTSLRRDPIQFIHQLRTKSMLH